MKFVYACDVHGDGAKYLKLIDICKEEKINYIVLGGDLYLKRCNRELEQPKYIRNELDAFFTKLEEEDINCICIPGNDDLEQLDDIFNEICSKHKNVYNVDNKALVKEGICFIGLSKVLDGPWNRKSRIVIEDNCPMQEQKCDTCLIEKGTREISSKEWESYREKNLENMRDILERLPKNTTDCKTIYIIHEPPYGVGLDVCYNNYLAGSRCVREFLENNNAYMSLHGHIHESPRMSGVWKSKLGKCISIQPGQTELSEPTFIYCIIDTDRDYSERFEIEL